MRFSKMKHSRSSSAKLSVCSTGGHNQTRRKRGTATMKSARELAREFKGVKLLNDGPIDPYTLEIIGCTATKVMVINSRGIIYYLPSSCNL